MAYREMMIVLANILWRFEMKVVPGSSLRGGGRLGAGYGRERHDEYQLYDFFAGAGSGPELCFERRRYQSWHMSGLRSGGLVEYDVRFVANVEGFIFRFL